MKNIKTALWLVITASSMFAMDADQFAQMEFKKYTQGIADKNGNNLWHVLAAASNKPYFDEYVKILSQKDHTPEEEDMLVFLASQKNNQNQIPLEIAAANWAPDENIYSGQMIKTLASLKAKDIVEYKSKKLGHSPFTDLIIHWEEQKKGEREKN